MSVRVLGQWVLGVRDFAGQDTGKLNGWSLDVVIEGSPRSPAAKPHPIFRFRITPQPA